MFENGTNSKPEVLLSVLSLLASPRESHGSRQRHQLVAVEADSCLTEMARLDEMVQKGRHS